MKTDPISMGKSLEMRIMNRHRRIPRHSYDLIGGMFFLSLGLMVFLSMMVIGSMLLIWSMILLVSGAVSQAKAEKEKAANP
jgi:hypothetical protein